MRGIVYDIATIRNETEKLIKDIFTNHDSVTITELEKKLSTMFFFRLGIDITLAFLEITPLKYKENNFMVKLKTWDLVTDYYLVEIDLKNKKVKKF